MLLHLSEPPLPHAEVGRGDLAKGVVCTESCQAADQCRLKEMKVPGVASTSTIDCKSPHLYAFKCYVALPLSLSHWTVE